MITGNLEKATIEADELKYNRKYSENTGEHL